MTILGGGFANPPVDHYVSLVPAGITTKNLWVTLSLLDGMIFEGLVAEEAVYGIYIYIGGQEDRLSLFPWHVVGRVVYKV